MTVAYSTATEITAIFAAFFVVLALIALVRTLYLRGKDRSASRRWRAGVFFEVEHDPPVEEPAPEEADTMVRYPSQG